MSDHRPFISDAELLSAIVEFESELPRHAVSLLPVPTRRGGRPVWAVLAADLVDTNDGERIGPVRGLRIVGAKDGRGHDETYAGPDLVPVKVPAGDIGLRRRLRLEIVETGAAFFAEEPSHATWMRVALRDAFPGDFILALAAIAPDFLAWLADSPADRA